MGKKLNSITPELGEFIMHQKIFFVGTAMKEGRINVSPKGMDTLRITNPNNVVWLNLTGSGNETAAHLLESGRMTIMFCAFNGKPLILRLYGKAKAYHEGDELFHDHIKLFPEIPGSRQVIVMDIDLVQTSCGFGVPLMEFKEERALLRPWAEKQGKERLKTYWKTRNNKSIDGYPTK